MIKGVHTTFYTSEPEVLREFIGTSSASPTRTSGTAGSSSIFLKPTWDVIPPPTPVSTGRLQAPTISLSTATTLRRRWKN